MKGGVAMARRSWLPVLVAAGLMAGCGPASSSAPSGSSPAAPSAPRTTIQINLPVSQGTAKQSALRMRQYWQAELGLTKAFNRHDLIWRLAAPRALPGRLDFGHPRAVQVEAGSGWAPGVVIWSHAVTVVSRSGAQQPWVLVTVQEVPGQSEQVADLVPQSEAGKLHSAVSASAAIPAAEVVQRYVRAIQQGRVADARALMAAQSGQAPDTALKTAKNVAFHGGWVDRVGKALFYDLSFSADVQYPQPGPRVSGPNTYFFVVSNLNGPWQILSEGSGP